MEVALREPNAGRRGIDAARPSLLNDTVGGRSGISPVSKTPGLLGSAETG